MKSIKGPAIFLAQFAGDAAPFNSFDAICEWASSLGYKGVQIPSWDARLFDVKKASDSKTYCDEISGVAARHGLARLLDGVPEGIYELIALPLRLAGLDAEVDRVLEKRRWLLAQRGVVR